MSSHTFTLRRPELTASDEGALHVRLDQSNAPRATESGTSLLVAGDWASCRCFADAPQRSADELYGPLAETIAAADLAVVNLECVLGDEGHPIAKDGPNLRGPASSAQALRRAGFHVAAMGNNHVMDYGPAGLANTMGLCEQAGLAAVGAGANLDQAMQPLLLDTRAGTLGILALADREEGDAEPDRPGVAPAHDLHVLDRIRDLRRRADLVLLVVHGGREYLPLPSPYWWERVLAMAGAGADLVVGHHPHVPQGLLLADRPDGPPIPVVFSTGNFVFRPASPGATIPPRTADGYLVEACLRDKSLAGLTLHPYAIRGPAGPRPLTGEELDSFATLLREISQPLTDRLAVHAWFDAAVDHEWAHGYSDRLAGLTASLCAGDRKGLRHGRSHHRSPAHTTLIDRAIQRQLDGTMGQADPDLAYKLAGWYAGTWPCPPLGQTVDG